MTAPDPAAHPSAPAVAGGVAVPDPAAAAPTHLRSCLLRDVRPRLGVCPGDADDRVDVRITDGVITEMGPDLQRRAGEEVHDGGGRIALPGLWDQHVHLGQWVLMAVRLDTAGAESPEDLLGRVVGRLDRLGPGETLQGWGHRTGGWSREPSVAELDAVSGDHPVVLISGDGHHAWCNSLALRLLGLPARDGVVAENEWFDTYPRLLDLPGVREGMERHYAEVVRAANAKGLVGVVDMEFGVDGYVDWPARFAGLPGCDPVDTMRVRASIYQVGLGGVLDAGLRSGEYLPGGGGLLQMGPLKVITDGSLNTRTAYCCEPFHDTAGTQHPHGVQNTSPQELRELMATCRDHGLEVAFHAIGDAAVRDVLDAFEATGATGSVEHAQLMRWQDVPRMARLAVRASVQPHHMWDDRDVVGRCWPDRSDRCFPLRALADAGVSLRLGSDAPVSPLDPWLEVAAAVHRSADERDPWHPEQALTVAEALAASTDGVARLEVGGVGDVVLLDRDPLAPAGSSREAAQALLDMPVAATIVAGRLVHGL